MQSAPFSPISPISPAALASLDFSVPVPVSLAAKVWLVDGSVPAGFPSPAEDMFVPRVEMAQLLGTDSSAIYLVRAIGDSMQGAGICDGDIVAVNKLLTPQHGDIVLAVVDNEMTIKRLYQRAGRVRLVAENPTFPDIRFKEGQSMEVWGVVTASLKLFRQPMGHAATRRHARR